jgi:competence protein ComEC
MRKDQILLVACLLYIGGVFAGSFFVAAWWIVFLCGAFLMVLSLVFARRRIFLVMLFFVMFSLGIFSVTKSWDQFREGNMRGGMVSGVARVINDPEEKGFYRAVVLRMQSCESEYCPREKILWQAPIATEVVFGSRANFICALKLPENFDAEFDYRMFLAKDNIGYMCREAKSAKILPEDIWAYLGKWLFLPKRVLVVALEKSLPQPEAGLAEGLLVGGDNHLPENLKQAFIKAGLSHIVAISGYNITLIAQGFVIFGIAIGLWRRQALWFSALGVIWFIVLVGAQASSIRAGIMGLSAFAAFFVGRLSSSINMLLCAAALMLFFQPLLLRYDVGFQLSFLAALAIIVVSPFIERLTRKKFFAGIFAETALMTFAVELFVTPLIIYQFHIFSPFALLANILILPILPYAMALAFIAGISFFILPGLYILPSTLAYFCLRIITWITEMINFFPGSGMKLSIGMSAIVSWYLILFLFIVIMKRYLRKQYAQNVQMENIF